jgi:hypothetical protein
MNFDQPKIDIVEPPVNIKTEKLPEIKPEDIGDDVPADLIPKNIEYNNLALSEEQKKMLIELGVAPIKEEYIPKIVYRGVKNSSGTKKLKNVINQLDSFNNYVKSASSESKLNKFLGKISSGYLSKKQASGLGINWLGVTLFTTPNKSVSERYSHGTYYKTAGGFFTKFSVKKENPVIITKAEAEKIIPNKPKTFKELEESNQKLIDLGIDGIMYNSDGNAIAWLNPKDTLEVKEVYKRLLIDTEKDTEFRDVSLYIKD